jgi:hypothetical protein
MSLRVAEVNALTTAWLQRWRGGGGVVSGACLWPLLAVLAASADEPGRTELAAAVGLRADESMRAAGEVLELLADVDGLDAAIGMWAQAAAQVSESWRRQLPPGTYGELTGNPATDRPMLDQWARERTHGLISNFPVRVGPQLLLTLATALALRTTWEHEFSDHLLVPSTGPWSTQRLTGLRRTTRDLDDVQVATTSAGALTMTRVAGNNGLDVHLVLAEEGRGAAETLAAAAPFITGEDVAETGSEVLANGTQGVSWPGMAIVPAKHESVAVTTVRFTVRSDHDLLQNASIFGLQTVTRNDRGHFSRIGPVSLRVDEARQAAIAIFTATGFEAAAVTAVGLRSVSMPVLRARGITVTYDRPFGFVTVHRRSGLVLFAGWVDSAQAWPPPTDGDSSE